MSVCNKKKYEKNNELKNIYQLLSKVAHYYFSFNGKYFNIKSINYLGYGKKLIVGKYIINIPSSVKTLVLLYTTATLKMS